MFKKGDRVKWRGRVPEMTGTVNSIVTNEIGYSYLDVMWDTAYPSYDACMDSSPKECHGWQGSAVENSDGWHVCNFISGNELELFCPSALFRSGEVLGIDGE